MTDSAHAAESRKSLFEQLTAPFGAGALDWKQQTKPNANGECLWIPYVNARAIQHRLDKVLGPGNWRNRFEPGPTAPTVKDVMCTIEVRIGDEWVGKSDGAPPTDRESVKGGYSDAFRRAAVYWGVGRYLSRVGGQWHPEKPKPSAQVFFSRLPAWAKPSTADSQEEGGEHEDQADVQPEPEPEPGDKGFQTQLDPDDPVEPPPSPKKHNWKSFWAVAKRESGNTFKSEHMKQVTEMCGLESGNDFSRADLNEILGCLREGITSPGEIAARIMEKAEDE